MRRREVSPILLSRPSSRSGSNQRSFPPQTRTRYTSSIWIRAWCLSWAVRNRAKTIAGIITMPAGSTMPLCLTRPVAAAWEECRLLTPSPGPVRTSFARPLPTPCPVRAGTTRPTERSAISARGISRKLPATRSSSNGRTTRINAYETAQPDRACHHCRKREPLFRQLLWEFPRCQRSQLASRPGSASRGRSSPRPCCVAGNTIRATPGRQRPISRIRHSSLLRVCPAVHTVRQLFHRGREPVRAKSPDAHSGRFTDHRQCISSPHLPAPGTVQHQVLAGRPCKGGVELGQLRGSGFQLLQSHQLAQRKSIYSSLDPVRHRRERG